MDFDLEERVIFEALMGSNAYGLNTSESDEDYVGIAIPPKEYFTSPFKNFDQHTDKNPDRVIYSIQKFFKLAANNNPNILELIWSKPELIKTITPSGQLIIDNASLFLSAKCKFTYSGYSWGQIQRMKTHFNWLHNVPEKPEDNNRSSTILSNSTISNIINSFRDFIAQHFTDTMMKELKFRSIDINVNELKDIHAKVFAEMPSVYFKEYAVKFFRSIANKFMKDEYISVIQDEFDYQFKLNEWKQYQNWKKNRNPKRAALEAKYGFDLKFSCHCVRLLKQCKEILTKGTLTLYVADDEDVLNVKNGRLSYDELMELVNKLNDEINVIYDNKEYVVPSKPNNKKIEELYYKVLDVETLP